MRRLEKVQMSMKLVTSWLFLWGLGLKYAVSLSRCYYWSQRHTIETDRRARLVLARRHTWYGKIDD